jgi:hypothetical protein
MRRSVLPLVALAGAHCAGCTGVGSSAYATGPKLEASTGPVLLTATRDPMGAQPLGVVEAHGDMRRATLFAVSEEFRARVASLGGDAGRVDSIATRYETHRETYTYSCGTPTALMTCTGSRQVEVPTLTLAGRAFKLAPGVKP